MAVQSSMKKGIQQLARTTCAIVTSAALLFPMGLPALGQTSSQAPMPGSEPAAKQTVTIPPEQLDSLVAPIALYPDNLLAQVMVASTYPLEIVQLHQWLEKNKDIQKDQKKLAEKVAKQPWDPSIQAMAPLPDVVKWLSDDIQWTTDLGNAFLAQQKDVMAAVQRMRQKAQAKGSLKSNEQMSVQTEVVESQSVIVIEQANPQVIYVPSYDPVYAYGPPAYPYPPIYYPPYYGTGAAVAAGVIGFGLGVAVGAAWGGGWGWGCGWGGNDININRNNNFNRNTNIQGGNRVNNIQSGKWQHNPTHRGGAPYKDRATADRFGGTTRGDSLANRQQGAQRDLGNRGAGSSNRADFGQRGGAGNTGNRAPGISDRSTGISDRNSGNRGGVSDRSSGNRGGVSNSGSSGRVDLGGSGSRGSGSDRMGGSSSRSNRSSGSSGGFGGSGSWGGSSTRSSSSRGSSSMGGSRSSGMSRGGGGMSRGGGGRRR